MIELVALILLAYLCGSVPFAKITGRLYGVDIQKKGSGNIGFANVLRVLGWKAAIPVLILDVLKGFIPTLLAVHYLNGPTAFIIGMCAIVGHIFPIWLKFKGGKGIATGLGVLLGVTPLIGGIGFGVYVLGSILLRNSSYASITAGLSVLVAGTILHPAYLWAYILLALIALWTLRQNLFGKVPRHDI